MDPITEKYRKAGFTLTPQRLAILSYLEGNRTHPSAEDVYLAVCKRFPTMSFATVYNTLEMLRKRGLLQELGFESGKKRFDPDTTHHHHIVCLGCGMVADVHTAIDPEVPEAARGGFDVRGSHTAFYGYCPACRTTGRNITREE